MGFLKALRGFSRIATGGIVGLDIFFLAFISGASMNPAGIEDSNNYNNPDKTNPTYIPQEEINREALREIYPSLSVGCFIRKPVTIDYLVERIMSELD